MSADVTHVLDTSALLAYYLKENGWEVVHQLIFDATCLPRVSSVTWLEFQTRLPGLTNDPAQRAEVMGLYRDLLGQGIPADDAIAASAYQLRQTAAERLPNMDALIAATAAEHGAILVHRDPHMAGIPSSVVSQLVLPDK
jgi:predicted nucleic acid-binding protein